MRGVRYLTDAEWNLIEPRIPGRTAGRNRRLMAHYEAIAVIAGAFPKLAMVAVMLIRPLTTGELQSSSVRSTC
ncbi:MAG: hypothetical protein ACLPIX_19560 [Rhodomicrobium sp.]